MAFVNNLAYEASAGSGKTFMLVVRYLSLLFRGADASKILALTFTNKAAAEMNERIIETLEHLESRGELYEIAAITELSPEYLLSQKHRLLASFLKSNTKIMTIDSFFTQLLRKFSLYEGLMPDFTTHASQHEVKLLLRFLKEVSVAGEKETLIRLTLEANKRVRDIFALLDDFYEKEEELSRLCFAPEPTALLEAKIMEHFNALAQMVTSSKTASATAKKSVDAKSIEELRQKAWLERETLNYRTFAKCYTPEMDYELREIQQLLGKYYSAKEQNFFYGLSQLLKCYKKAKKALYKEESELGFSDVTQLLFAILNRVDDREFLYFRIDAAIEHMLLDEFQDTSIMQYKILKPMIEEITAGSGIFDDGSFFFVGDVKQSIYRFRGGVSALFHQVAREQRTCVEKLLTNYRSKAEVVSFVNDVFVDKIAGYTPQLVREGAEGGYVEVLESDGLVESVAFKVKKLLELGANENDIAVLCVTNGDGELVKNTLQEEGVSVVTETTTKLINQKSIKAIIEYMKYLYFKEDIYRYNFFALIEQPLAAIEHVDISSVKLHAIAKKIIEKYGLFSDDFHTIRFLHTLSHYKDIDAFVFEYERLDVSAAASDVSGVRVLTIHKSKGLEYKHVIVMDRVGRGSNQKESIIYEYDGIELQNLFLRTKGRESLDVAYAKALQKENALEREDSLNALYVAFTRAKEHLFIIQKEKSSAFSIVELSVMQRGELLVEKTPKAAHKKHLPLVYEELYYGTQSDLLATQKSEQEDLSAISFGLALHYMLEMMERFNEASIANAKMLLLNKYGATLSVDEIDELVKRVTMLVNNREFLELSEGKCFKEKALRYKKNLRYLDLLVHKDDGSYVVIDYKSATSHSDEHKKQVGSYVHAVKSITKESRVSGYLCYLLPTKIQLVEV